MSVGGTQVGPLPTGSRIASDERRAVFAERPLAAVPSRPSPLARLQAVVLLAGSLRETAFHAGVERSVLDLPVDGDRTLSDCWREECVALARHLGRGLAARVLVGGAARQPRGDWEPDARVVLSVEREPRDLRGTAGVLCDLAQGYGADDYLLVANAAQVLRTPLTALAAALSQDDPDASLVSHTDGTPSGVMLLRCGCLADLPRGGFLDMKEQALPLLAARHRVLVVARGRPTGLPVRTLSDYVDALRAVHGVDASESPEWVDEGEPVFSLVEPGAQVHPRATVHNSVVLAGARVDEGAVVVGSVVCPGAVVRRGAVVCDELVGRRRPR